MQPHPNIYNDHKETKEFRPPLEGYRWWSLGQTYEQARPEPLILFGLTNVLDEKQEIKGLACQSANISKIK
jgi:hypothetical protein